MNHYEVLGVRPDATETQIKEAYRIQAMKWHPDRHSGTAAKGEADRRFKDLAVAYRTLRNAEERANYDRQLEQQLRREYDSRQQADAKQQERARQERAQQEHARAQTKQKEAPQDSAKADFANTGPQFEETSAADDDAKQMFYEQMLDLAIELVGRGFPEFNVSKALVAMGCPEALAKIVAARATKLSQPSPNPSGYSRTDKNSNARGASGEPNNDEYYLAAIGPKNRDFYLEKFRKFDRTGTAGFSWPGLGQFFASSYWLFYRRISLAAWLYLLLPFIALLFIHIISDWNALGDSIQITIHSAITVVIYYLYLPSRMNAMYYRHVHKKIQAAKAKSKVLDTQLTLLREGGGTSSTVVWLLLALMLFSIWAAVALPAYQDYTRRAQVATGLKVGYEAASKVGAYYATHQKGPNDLAAAGFSPAPSETVKDLIFNNRTGVIAITLQNSYFDARPLLLVPNFKEGKLEWLCTSEGISSHDLPSSCNATREEADARLSAINSAVESNNQVQKDYDLVLAATEQRYPELNPDSPRYNARSLEWVAARKTTYENNGQTPTDALRQAVTDYETAMRAEGSPSVTQLQRARVQESTAFFGGVGEELSLNFDNIDIRSLLQVFEDASGRRLTVDDQVRGSVNIRIVQQPWTHALLQFLQQNQLAIIKFQNGYYVFPASFSEETAFRRASQSRSSGAEIPTKPPGSISRSSVQQSKTGETICQTWPEACR